MTLFALPKDLSFDMVPRFGDEAQRKGGNNFFAFPGEQGDEQIIPGLEAHLGQGRNIIILLMGRRGQGKTAFQTTMLQRQLAAILKTGADGRLYSNYAVSFFRPQIDLFDPYLIERLAYFPPWFRKGYMAVDEIQGAAASRRSTSKSNVNISLFLTQLRHRNIEAIFTTQFPQVLDYQVLLQVDLFVRVQTIRRDKFGFPLVMALEIYDYWGQFTGRDMRKRWPPQPEDIDAERLAVIPPSVRGSYDTHEIIASSYWDPLVRERVMLSEAEGRGQDAEWLEALRPAIVEAQVAKAGGKVRAGLPYDDIYGLVQEIVRAAGASTHPLPLQPFLAQAQRLSGYQIASVPDLVREIKDVASGQVTIIEHLNLNKTVSYLVEVAQ